MSFASHETSRLNGRPFHLYAIRYGPETSSVAYYTNLATEVVYGVDELGRPITYHPLAIGHGEVVASGNLDRSTLDVTIPDVGIIPDLYRDESPSSIVSLTIRQGHVGDSDMKIHWAGQVVGSSFNDGKMMLTCEPVSSSMRRTGLTQDWQLTCRHTLYGARCQADRMAATSTHRVTSVDGAILEMPAGWATPAYFYRYLGGMVEWTMPDRRKNRRTIVSASGAELRLNAPAIGLTAGAEIHVVFGCDKTMTTCRQVHRNILNFGGQPEIPLQNPIGITNNYY